MERDSLKRGVELANRFGGSEVEEKIQATFAWWKGGKVNKTTFLFLGFVFIVNFFLISPLFERDIALSYSSSTVLMFLGNLLEGTGLLSKVYFFQILTFASLSLAPVSFYLFVIRTALGHEITGLLATLLYILPIPFFGGGLPFAQAILSGDGAHAFAFSFVPLLLLSVESFIATGVPFWRAVSSIGIATTAIISPFAVFNLLIFIFITTTAEGFMGNFRVKVTRLLFLLIASSGLSLFWYYPNIIGKILDLSHVSYALNKFWSIFPLLVPSVPILGIILFLILDRREKLKPIFISLSLFIIYVSLYLISRDFKITGIFTSDRYLLELAFGASYFFALIFIVFVELIIRSYIPRVKNDILLFISILTCSALVFLLGAFVVVGVIKGQEHLKTQPIVNSYNLGIGNIGRAFNFKDGLSIVPISISILTFIFLLFFLRRSSYVVDVKEGELSSQGDLSSEKEELPPRESARLYPPKED